MQVGLRNSCLPLRVGSATNPWNICSRAFLFGLKPFAVSEGEDDSVAEGVEEVVFSVAILVADAEALDLIKQMMPSAPLVDEGFVESVLSVFDKPAVHVAGDGNRPFVLAHCREL